MKVLRAILVNPLHDRQLFKQQILFHKNKSHRHDAVISVDNARCVPTNARAENRFKFCQKSKCSIRLRLCCTRCSRIKVIASPP